jgi:hypothetical protein
MFHVYKLHLSDEIAAVVNSKGWSRSPEGAAYAALRGINGDNASLTEHVLTAALMGLYHHGLSAEAPSLWHFSTTTTARPSRPASSRSTIARACRR